MTDAGAGQDTNADPDTDAGSKADAETTAPLRLAVTGADGRMGREVIEAAVDRPDVRIVLAVNRSETDPIAGITVEPADEFVERLTAVDSDVVVDFTGPESTVVYAHACSTAGVPIVTGTTGFDAGQLEELRAVATTIPVLKAANFSRGVAALRRAVREAVAALPGYDVELTETHHNGKVDAPSGTAKTLLEDIEDVRSDLDGRVHGRVGDAPRDPDEIGVHARRAGDVTGEHEVLVADNHETLELTHRAGDRGVFAAGALDAAVWLADREAGWYTFDDAIEEAIEDAGEETATDAADH